MKRSKFTHLMTSLVLGLRRRHLHFCHFWRDRKIILRADPELKLENYESVHQFSGFEKGQKFHFIGTLISCTRIELTFKCVRMQLHLKPPISRPINSLEMALNLHEKEFTIPKTLSLRKKCKRYRILCLQASKMSLRRPTWQLARSSSSVARWDNSCLISSKVCCSSSN